MSEADGKKEQGLKAFEAFWERAKSEGGTGDPSLNLLLASLEPSVRRLVQDLAVPHWFDERVINSINEAGSARQVSPKLVDEIVGFSFVRSHPRGYAYHDLVREALRLKFVRQDPNRLREVSRRVAELFPRDGRNGQEDLVWERVYLTLAYDEDRGFKQFEELFMSAHRARRFTVCDTLVGMANEQRPLLSSEGFARLDYYRGVFAFDVHDFEKAEGILRELVRAGVPQPLNGRVILYMGLVLEAQGSHEEAGRVYRGFLSKLKSPESIPELSARLYHRLAQVELTLGNLKDAEESARRSLSMNQDAGDLPGQALSFETMGNIYEKLRDLAKSQSAFEQSLTLFSQAGREYDKARIYGTLATLQESFGRWSEAESWYKRALDARAEAGDDYGLGVVYANLGNLHVRQGRTDMALRYLETGLNAFERFHDHLRSAQVLRNIALVYERLNDLTSARERLRRAIQELPEGHKLRPSYERELVRLENISR